MIPRQQIPMRKWRQGILGLMAGAWIFTLTGGCAPPQSKDFVQATDAYRKLIYSHTQREYFYHGLETILAVQAVYLDWPLRQAYVDKYAIDQSLSPQVREKLLSQEREQDSKNCRFWLALASDHGVSVDLNTSDSIWQVRLLGPHGERIAPSRVELQNPPSPYFSLFAPHYSEFMTVYQVDFPKSASGQGETQDIGLEMKSALGGITLHWSL